MPATAAALANLRSLIEQRFPDATPPTARTTEQVASGISQLDRCLPAGGFPRGRLSVWSPLGGATAILRASCYAVTSVRSLTTETQLGRFLAGIFGWDPRPSIEQVAAYGAYVVPVGWFYFLVGHRSSRGANTPTDAMAAP